MKFAIYHNSKLPSQHDEALEASTLIKAAGHAVTYENCLDIGANSKASIRAEKSVRMPRYFLDAKKVTKRNNGGLTWLKKVLEQSSIPIREPVGPKATEKPKISLVEIEKAPGKSYCAKCKGENVNLCPKCYSGGDTLDQANQRLIANLSAINDLHSELRSAKQRITNRDKRISEQGENVASLQVALSESAGKINEITTNRDHTFQQEMTKADETIQDLNHRLEVAGRRRGRVFVVTFGAQGAEQGEFFEAVSYDDDVDAIASAVRCMESLGGRPQFKEMVRPQFAHVERCWDSGDHTVWLERLDVQ